MRVSASRWGEHRGDFAGSPLEFPVSAMLPRSGKSLPALQRRTVQERCHRGGPVSFDPLEVKLRAAFPVVSELGNEMRRILLLIALLLSPSVAKAELSVRQIRMVEVINTTVMSAGVSYAAGDYQQAGNQIGEAIKQVDAAMQGGSPELYDRLLPAIKRIRKAHAMLEFEGVSLPPFQPPARPRLARSGSREGRGRPSTTPTRGPSPPRPDPNPPKPEPSPSPESVPPSSASMTSFTGAIAPILVRRCGRCHVTDNKGGFSAASYSALMKGPPEGVVVFAGDTVGSRLIETIETGDMPRGGGRVTPQELQTLKAWILAGAQFDGTDPDAPIGGAATPPRVNMNVEVRRATGSETVSFAADVAPLLVENCNGCHIDATQTRGGLRMDTFAQLLRGGDSGSIIVPGKGSESLLVQKLRGMVGNRMPAGDRPALSEDSIALISTWIDEGATLDGTSATQPLGVMSQLAWAAAATPEQLSERRANLAAKHLRLVTASSGEIASYPSDHFLVTGPVSSQTLKWVAELAEDQMKTVRSVIKSKSGESFYRGKATIFVFPKRYDYSEFARMVESRSIPTDWTSHWKYDGIDAYVSLVCGDREEEEMVESRLAAPLVSLAVATRGRDVPRWFAEGTGVATAHRLAGSRDRDARRKQEAGILAAIASLENAKQFLEGKLAPKQTDRIGAALSATLLDRSLRRGFDSMVRLLEEGQSFEEAFQQAYRVTPQRFVEAWIKSR